MIKFTTQELEMESNLKQRIEFICEFCHTTPKIINGSIKRINNTNLNYLEPHKIIINNTIFLAFNYSTDIYIFKEQLYNFFQSVLQVMNYFISSSLFLLSNTIKIH